MNKRMNFVVNVCCFVVFFRYCNCVVFCCVIFVCGVGFVGMCDMVSGFNSFIV